MAGAGPGFGPARPIGHGWTCSAHPVCAAAGAANLKLIDARALVGTARTTGAHFRARLAEALADHPDAGEVRRDGLRAAAEFIEDRDDRRVLDPARKVGSAVAAALFERGVIGRARPQGDILAFAPPFCLTPDEAHRVVDATAGAVASVLPR